MRRAILSLLAVALTIPVFIGVVQGSYSLETAALRIAVLAIAVPFVDLAIAQLLRLTTALMAAPNSKSGA
jgi:hypothetical protein